MQPEVVATDVGFCEGPVWRPDGTVLVTSVDHGVIYGVDAKAGGAKVFSDTMGGANGAALASDGGLLVAQNGGHEMTPIAHLLGHDALPARRTEPGLQRVMPDGSVTYLADEGFSAPNDICVSDSGEVVWFTDPVFTDPIRGRVWQWDGSGPPSVYADGIWSVNGIAVEPEGSLVVVERTGLRRLYPDGSREWVIETIGQGAGDGFCMDRDGRFYVAVKTYHAIVVIEDGTVVEQLPVQGLGHLTNCCFGGDDLRTLYATEAIPGNVLAWEGMPTPGMPLSPWRVDSTRRGDQMP